MEYITLNTGARLMASLLRPGDLLQKENMGFSQILFLQRLERSIIRVRHRLS